MAAARRGPIRSLPWATPKTAETKGTAVPMMATMTRSAWAWPMVRSTTPVPSPSPPIGRIVLQGAVASSLGRPKRATSTSATPAATVSRAAASRNGSQVWSKSSVTGKTVAQQSIEAVDATLPSTTTRRAGVT
jgi:hypothetical protein